MFIELLDVLRCVQAHEDSWLVGSFDRVVERHVVQGTLGCPVCGAEYPVADGIAHFAGAFKPVGRTGASPPGESAAAPGGASSPGGQTGALRLAAVLGLAEPGGIVMLIGQRATQADALRGIAPQVQPLLVNPPGPLPPLSSAVTAGRRLPVATGSIRAIAFESGKGDGPAMDDCVRALGAGGRLVAAARVPLPEGVTELARDDQEWVAQRDIAAESGPVLRLSRRK